jgi:hypothetical protein
MITKNQPHYLIVKNTLMKFRDGGKISKIRSSIVGNLTQSADRMSSNCKVSGETLATFLKVAAS